MMEIAIQSLDLAKLRATRKDSWGYVIVYKSCDSTFSLLLAGVSEHRQGVNKLLGGRKSQRLVRYETLITDFCKALKKCCLRIKRNVTSLASQYI